jgi:hypothetical protein
MPGYIMQPRSTTRTLLPQAQRHHLKALQMLRISSLQQSQSGLETQTANQSKVYSFITKFITTLAQVFVMPSQGLQPDFKSLA